MKEIKRSVLNGWLMLTITLGLWIAFFALFGWGIWSAAQHAPNAMSLMIASGVIFLLAFFCSFGFFTVQPNEARILLLFGRYKGTVFDEGFHWANPFSVTRSSIIPIKDERSVHHRTLVKKKNRFSISLRIRNFETAKLKVNDQRGNPIEISAVVVWRVVDTFQALFMVDDYESYVTIQSESALRQLANRYPYDHSGHAEDEVTLRDDAQVVCEALKATLEERLIRAGVLVEEARLNHLAYAPEIATAMLRRQQAEAIIAARQKIVQGAVGMVEMALEYLSAKKVVELDEERKAAMVGNLLVVLCGETEAQPVVNTGTLYP